MHHSINVMLAENPVESIAITCIPVDEFRAGRYRAPAAMRQIVVHNDFAAFHEQLRRDHASDVARSSCNDNAIRHFWD